MPNIQNLDHFPDPTTPSLLVATPNKFSLGMSETKRSISQVSDVYADHDDKKQHTKVGRKPIETEPKSKRTAQNRAAQRAYRERKERKMKDLEDKVALLEDDRIKAVTELDLLKAQVDLLKRELSRYRGNADFSDLPLTQPQPQVKQEQAPQVAVEFPWLSKNLDKLDLPDDSLSSQLPDLVSGSSSCDTSPLNDNVLVSPELNSSDNLNPLASYVSPHNQFSAAPLFEEQLDPFCSTLSEGVCGTKEKPVPKYRREVAPAPPLSDEVLPQWNMVSPFHSLFSPGDNVDLFLNGNVTNLSLPATSDADPLSFLNDNNFDVNLAFGNAVNDVVEGGKSAPLADPLAGLTTEESAYDQFTEVNTDFNFNEFVKSSLPSESSTSRNSVSGGAKSSVTSFDSPSIPEEEESKEVVPAPEKTLRCLEVWDRITSHPRYTDIDIDGLCNELKTKAKCLEKGVVLNANDVNSLLERSALKR